jgi:hypothetical protein
MRKIVLASLARADPGRLPRLKKATSPKAWPLPMVTTASSFPLGTIVHCADLDDEHGVRLISLIEYQLALPVLSRRRNLEQAGEVCICSIFE